jgi:hypothetical protein
MCRLVECRKCGRPTYAGCGAHVEQVLGHVPPAERCQCREERSEKPKGAATSQARSWLRSLLGR